MTDNQRRSPSPCSVCGDPGLHRCAPPRPVLNEDLLRQEFHRQHSGRNLKQHRLRGTYVSANMAALWNQHRRTAIWLMGSGLRPAGAAVAREPSSV